MKKWMNDEEFDLIMIHKLICILFYFIVQINKYWIHDIDYLICWLIIMHSVWPCYKVPYKTLIKETFFDPPTDSLYLLLVSVLNSVDINPLKVHWPQYLYGYDRLSGSDVQTTCY